MEGQEERERDLLKRVHYARAHNSDNLFLRLFILLYSLICKVFELAMRTFSASFVYVSRAQDLAHSGMLGDYSASD